jgi:Glycerophosphoryl diester phosphodiesterase family
MKLVLPFVLVSLFVLSSPCLFAQTPVVVKCSSGPNNSLVVDPAPFPSGSTVLPSSSRSNINTSKVLKIMNQGSPDFVIVSAHRGDWYSCPENTTQSLQQGINDGLEALEVDLRTTADGTLVVSHDADLIKETNWSFSSSSPGLISQTNWSTISSLGVRDRRGFLQPESKMLQFSDVLQLLQQNSSGGEGPVLLVDMKDAGNSASPSTSAVWQAYLQAVSQVAQYLDSATRPAVVFKIRISALPISTSSSPLSSSLQSQCAAHPNYGHIVAVTYSADGTDPNYGPRGTYSTTIVNMNHSSSAGGNCGDANSTPANSFIQQYELNIKNISDTDALFLTSSGGSVNSFSVFDPFAFYPEGTTSIYSPTRTDINPTPPEGATLLKNQTFCCILGDLDNGAGQSSDFRAVVDFPFTFDPKLSPGYGVSFITSDNLPTALTWLVSIGKRNVSEIQ